MIILFVHNQIPSTADLHPARSLRGEIKVRLKGSNSLRFDGSVPPFFQINIILSCKNFMVNFIAKAHMLSEVERAGSIELDRESLARFLRLKKKLPNLQDEEVIAHALKSLEHKTDQILRKIALKKVRKLKSEGLSPENVAEQLNKNGVPPLGETERWQSGDVSALQEQALREVKKTPSPNQSPPHS